jgi:hypothetical protein
LAAGSFSARTSYEMIARRIDESTAVKPACTATHANNTLTRLTCSTACISRMTTDQLVAAEVTSSSLRRSTASAIEPP